MENFMTYDFNISEITLAMFVKPGFGRSIHKSRNSHGIAFNVSDSPKKYIFSDNKTILVEQNEIVYLPKNSSYTVSAKTSGNCYAINFDISKNIDFEPFSFKLKNPSAFLTKFEKAANLWENKNTAYHMQCKEILYNIISRMQIDYSLKYITHSTSDLITRAVDYIKKYYTNEYLSIPELSKMCGISDDYFRKIFKNTFGISPRKYINDLKLSYAKELIKSDMYTVTEAAELSGYTDMSYFSREFKKAFDFCPADFKKHTK